MIRACKPFYYSAHESFFFCQAEESIVSSKALLRCQRLVFTSQRGVKLCVACAFSFIVSSLVSFVIFGKKAFAKTVIVNVILVQHMAFLLAADISNHSPNANIP